MHASQPVRPPPSRVDGHLGAIGWLVAIALAIAIVKPWGDGAGASLADLTSPPLPTASPSPTPTPPPQVGFSGLAYDPSIFGNREPEAKWGIWPAGYLVTFGFVIQVPASPSPSPGAPGAPAGGSTPTPAAPSATFDTGPAASRSGVPDGPVWPSLFEVPEGDHLLLIGINMPRGYAVRSAQLGRYAADGSVIPVETERLRAPWPDHFAVFGIATGSDDGRLDVWPPGRYRLDLTFEPGRIGRSIEIRIAGPTI